MDYNKDSKNVIINKILSTVQLNSKDNEKRDNLQQSLYFWDSNFKFMLNKNVVIFTGIKENVLTPIDVFEVMKQLISLKLIDHVKAIYILSHPAYTYIEFSNGIIAAEFQNNSHQINNTPIHYLSLEQQSQIINIFIEKIPASILEEFLPPLLNQWGKIIKINPSSLSLLNGNQCNAGSTKVIFKLDPGKSTTDLPYFIKIKNLRIYLHITNRPKICFRCLATDHLVSNCSYKYCVNCRSNQSPSHTCQNSYASRLNTNNNKWFGLLLKAQEDIAIEQIGLQSDAIISNNISVQNVSDNIDTIQNLEHNTTQQETSPPSVKAKNTKKSQIVLNPQECSISSEFSHLPQSDSSDESELSSDSHDLVDMIESKNNPEISMDVSSISLKRPANKQMSQINLKKKPSSSMSKPYHLRKKSSSIKDSKRNNSNDSLNGIKALSPIKHQKLKKNIANSNNVFSE